MGDLRNKARKQEEREAIEAMQGALAPRRPAPWECYPGCHVCGREPSATLKIYCCPHDRWEPARFLCQDHLTEEDRALMNSPPPD